MLYEEVRSRRPHLLPVCRRSGQWKTFSGVIIPRTLGSLVAGFNVYDCKKESELEALQNKGFNAALEIVEIDFQTT